MGKKKQNKQAERTSRNSMTHAEQVKAFDERPDRDQIVAWKKAYSDEYTKQSTGNNVGQVETIIGEVIMFVSILVVGLSMLYEFDLFGLDKRVVCMAGFAVGLVFFAIGTLRNKKEREKFKESDVRKTVIDTLGYNLTREQHDAFTKRQEARAAMIQDKRDVLQVQAQEKKLSNRIKKLRNK